ncbi:MAG: murein hydrolase activator EnvC family protein [Thermodesulfobacteriota bacterium]
MILIWPGNAAWPNPEKLQKEDWEKKLGGLQKKIAEEKEKVKRIHQKESSAISQLNTLDRNLSKKEKELKLLNQKLSLVSKKVEKTNKEIQSLNQAINAQVKSLEERLIALYKIEDLGFPQLLLNSGSFAELANNQSFLATILRQDRQIINDYQNRQNQLGNYREQLQNDEEELQLLKRKAEKKRKEIYQDRLKKSELLESVRNEKKIHLASIRELEIASNNLQSLIDRLEKKLREQAQKEILAPASKGFANHRGKLPFPVEGRLLSTFGRNENPKFNTFTIQKGIEIEAPLGAEVRAIYDGRVLYADWFKGYGKILIIDHGEGFYTLFGHASQLLKKPGDEVKAGDVVALVGDTGSLKGPCLYFEIRRQGKPLNPLEWLSQSAKP